MSYGCLNYCLDWTFLTVYNHYIYIYVAKLHHTCLAPVTVQVTYKVFSQCMDRYVYILFLYHI